MDLSRPPVLDMQWVVAEMGMLYEKEIDMNSSLDFFIISRFDRALYFILKKEALIEITTFCTIDSGGRLVGERLLLNRQVNGSNPACTYVFKLRTFVNV